MNYKTLYNGVKIPEIGYGTYKTPAGDICENGVRTAIETGYRLIDTAAFYGNEKSVKDGIIDSNICRNDIFITTKLWNDDHGYDNTLRAFEKSLKNLGGDYIDLYLIHWPVPLKHRDDWQNDIKDTWRAFERLYDEKAVRAVGVSNFLPHHLDYLLANANVMPMVNQIEIHIGYPETETVNYCKDKGIAVEAWAPIAKAKAFDIPEIKHVAETTGKTPAQVLIRWCIDKGVIPLPKSVTPERIVENFNVSDFTLSEEETRILDGVTDIGRLGSHPDDCRF